MLSDYLEHMKNKATTMNTDQNVAAAVAIMDSIRQDLPNRRVPVLREHIKHSLQALRILRNIRANEISTRFGI